jgi:hypothetical protein
MVNLFDCRDIFLCVFSVMNDATELITLASTCKTAWKLYKKNEEALLNMIAERNGGCLILTPEPRLLHGMQRTALDDAFVFESAYYKGKPHGLSRMLQNGKVMHSMYHDKGKLCWVYPSVYKI